MTLSINTSHALYANVVSLIAVDGGALVDLKTARTFTPHANATFGTGTYGAHFRPSTAGVYNPQGASFTPALATTPASTSYTLFVVLNAATAGAGGGMLVGSTSGNGRAINVAWNANYAGPGNSGAGFTYGTTTDITGTGAHTLIVAQPSGDGATMQLYVDNVAEATSNCGFTGTTEYDYIGGHPSGLGSVGGDIVYIVIFNKILNSTERTDLIASLGPSNAFGLITVPADTTAPVLSSPTGTATGTTTASGTVSTNEGNGTLYRLASINATESAATIKAAALTTAVTATGSQSVSFTGLTPGTLYYAHYVQDDAGGPNTSNVVNSTSFTQPVSATAVTMTGPTSGVTGAASTNFTVGVTPIGGVITGTVIVTPADGGAGGTFTPTTKSLTTGSPTGTFTYTAASAGAKTISATNNGSLTNPSNITYTASSASATATVVSGPSSGTVGVASTNFTASANGVISGTVVITPADGGAGGTFSPTTVSISAGSPTATFTYTAASAGAKTLSFTNSGSLTNQGNLTYTATASSIATFAYTAPGKRTVGGLRTGVAHRCTVHDKSTRALLATKTGLTSDSTTGLVSFTLVASGTIVAGTEYLLMPIADDNDYDFGTMWVTAT